MNSTLISVVTTVRNGEGFIYETLTSVYHQSYKDYEHIVVNDGSVDKTLDIISTFKSDYPNNKIRIINTKGVGRGYALNLGVKESRADWVAIIDADDLWHRNKLEIQSKFLSNEVSVIATGHESFLEKKSSSPFEKKNKAITLGIEDFLVKNSICHSSVIVRKKDCVYNVTRKSQFDLELWLRLSLNKKRIIKIAETLTYHRIHRGQHFESRLGKKMIVNSFVLKASFAIKSGNFMALLNNSFRFCVSMIIPKKIVKRLKKIKLL